ncbi:MAG: hypothetical protein V4850_34900 [Myxococcota bacterium]
MSGSIAGWLTAIGGDRIEASPRELAELLWLGATFGEELRPRTPVVAPLPPVAGSAPPPPLADPLPEGAKVEVSLGPPGPEVPAPGEGGMQTVQASLKRPERRKERLLLSRAFHRLGSVELVGRNELDVAATVRRSAETDALLLQYRRGPARATDLLLLEDAAGQMEVWREQVRALATAARASNRFGRVVHQPVDLSGSGIAVPVTLPGRTPVTRIDIGEPGRALLVLVVTDGLGRGVPTGGVLELLDTLHVDASVAWLHPWGPGRWEGTWAGRMPWAPPGVFRRGRPDTAVGVPLVPLASAGLDALEGWAQGRAARGLYAKAWRRSGPPPARGAGAATPAAPATPAERAAAFERGAEPESCALLGLAAAVPGNIDVDLLIALGGAFAVPFQRFHLAQALTSGLLERVGTEEPLLVRFRGDAARRAALRWTARQDLPGVMRFLLGMLERGEGRDRLGIDIDLLLHGLGEADAPEALAGDGAAALRAIVEVGELGGVRRGVGGIVGRNPFNVFSPAVGPAGFVGRERLLDAVCQSLRDPEREGVVLHGPRRMGVTSLLRVLETRVEGWGTHVAVYMNMSGESDPVGFVRLLVGSISRAYELPPPLFGDGAVRTVLTEWLPGVLERSGRPLVVFLDEIARVASWGESSGLLEALLVLRERAWSRLKLVLALDMPPADLHLEAAQLLRGFETHRVGLLDREDTLALIRASRASLDWTEDAIEEVWRLTGGHPFLTQYLCRKSWALADEEGRGGVTTQDVRGAARVAVRGPDLLDWWFNGLSPECQSVVRVMAEHGDEPLATAVIERRLQGNRLFRSPGGLADAIARLGHEEILATTGSSVQFKIGLFRVWARERAAPGPPPRAVEPPQRWVLVAGTAEPDLPPAVNAAAEALGRALASAGWGVVTNGWHGVDHVVARTYLEHGGAPGGLRQIVEPPRAADFRGAASERGDQELSSEWSALGLVDAVVVIGGRTWTRQLVDSAQGLGVPVVPFVGSGGVATELSPRRMALAEAPAEAVLRELQAVPRRIIREDALLRPATEYLAPQSLRAADARAATLRARLELPDPRDRFDVHAALASPRSPERVVAYIALGSWPRGADCRALAEALAREPDRALAAGGETRPLWQGLVALGSHFHVTAIPDDDRGHALGVLQRLGDRLREERTLDPGGEAKRQIAELLDEWAPQPVRGVEESLRREADEYERIRRDAKGAARVRLMNELRARVAGIARDAQLPASFLHELFRAGTPGRRLVALAACEGRPGVAPPEVVAAGIATPLKRFEQWAAVNAAAALEAERHPFEIDAIVGAVVDQLRDPDSLLNDSKDASRRNVALPLLRAYQDKIGLPGPLDLAALMEWLAAGRHQATKPAVVFGSGAAHATLCRALGVRLAERGWRLFCGDGRGVGREVLAGFRSVKAAEGRSRRLTAHEFDLLAGAGHPGQSVADFAGYVIVIGGRMGTAAECEAALAADLPVLALPFTGGTAQALAGAANAALHARGVSPRLLGLLGSEPKHGAYEVERLLSLVAMRAERQG